MRIIACRALFLLLSTLALEARARASVAIGLDLTELCRAADAVVHGTVASLVDAGVVFVYFGAFSLWSFGYKLYRYGHDLAPTAPVKVEPFTPPILGYRRIANFEVYSYPDAATYAMAAALLLLALAFVLAWRSARRERVRRERPYAVAA